MRKQKSNVSVFIEVFNEEERLEMCLRSFCWADELYVFDKQSTDRTYEIAKQYATEVVQVPYTQASENIVDNISTRGTSEWCFFITASSLIHPHVVDKIISYTRDETFAYDVIGMPYGMYSFGICNDHSPWMGKRKHTLMRRSVLCLSQQLHCEMSYANDSRIYDMPIMNKSDVLYHCTHKDADDFFDKLVRYTKYEAEYEKRVGKTKRLRRAFADIFRAALTVVFKRRSFLLGWDGVALSLAYMCYFVMKFIYVWDLSRDNGNVIYPRLRDQIDQAWQKHHD